MARGKLSKRSYLFIAVAILVAAGLIGRLLLSPSPPRSSATGGALPIGILPHIESPISQTKGDVVYAPLTIIGRADAQQRLYVLWDQSERSSAFLRDAVMPLVSSTYSTRPTRAIILIQDITRPEAIGGPGFLLFCAENPSAYVGATLRYINDRNSKDTIFSQPNDRSVVLNKSVEAALAEIHSDRRRCLAKDKIYKRTAYAIGYVGRIRERFKLGMAPLILWGNTQVRPGDATQLRRLTDSWR